MREYDLYLPSVASRTRSFEEILESTKARLTERFGGVTDTRHRNEGRWKIGRMIVRDEVRVLRVLSDEQEEGDAFLRALKIELERELEQDLILIVKREVATL